MLNSHWQVRKYGPHLREIIENFKKSSRLSDFCRALVFEFVAPPPLDQILTTSEQLCKVPWGTSQIDVSNGGQSPELIGVGCEVKVRIWGQITD